MTLLQQAQLLRKGRLQLLRHLLRHLRVELHHRPVLDVLGARGVLQRVERLVEVVPAVSSGSY